MKPNPNSDEPRFSIRQLLVFVMLFAFLFGILTIAYQSRQTRQQLSRIISEQQIKIEDLNMQLRNARGDGIRTAYAEKILFHVASNRDTYPELVTALDEYDQQKLGISLHPLGETDNLTYVNVYRMRSGPNQAPRCFSFLVTEEPFEVLDFIQGEQSRLPRLQDGTWYCGAGKDGQDVWYEITDDSFERVVTD